MVFPSSPALIVILVGLKLVLVKSTSLDEPSDEPPVIFKGYVTLLLLISLSLTFNVYWSPFVTYCHLFKLSSPFVAGHKVATFLTPELLTHNLTSIPPKVVEIFNFPTTCAPIWFSYLSKNVISKTGSFLASISFLISVFKYISLFLYKVLIFEKSISFEVRVNSQDLHSISSFI